MERTGAPGLSFCLPHPELGDFFLTGSALLETVGFDLIRLGTRKQPSGRPRIASRLSDHASTLRYIACGAPKIQWLWTRLVRALGTRTHHFEMYRAHLSEGLRR